MKLSIIGNGMATDAFLEAWTSVEKVRREEVEITVFADEHYVAYNRILLVDVMTRRHPMEKIFQKTPDWYDRHEITVRTGTRIVRIDPLERQVVDGFGNRTAYDKLLVAVGARPFMPPVEGINKEGVCVLRTIDDIPAIIGKAQSKKRAVVVGGGLLGLEAAKGLSDLGVVVTVLHIRDRLMDQQMDHLGGSLLKKEIERRGIEILLSAHLEEIGGNGSVESVRLKTGETLKTDLVLICAGIVPDLRLVSGTGIETRRGICVNDHLETSVPDIYAIGDVIEHRGQVYGLVAPLIAQARILANNLSRRPEEPLLAYEGTKCATTLKVSGISVTSSGNIHGNGNTDELVHLDSGKGHYRKLLFEGNRLIGAILVGDTKGSPGILRLIESGDPADELRNDFFSGNVQTEKREPDDKEVVCHCHGVTRGQIVSAVRGKGLKTRQDVATFTKASTGCGSCSQPLTELVADTLSKPPAVAIPALSAAGNPAPVSLPQVAASGDSELVCLCHNVSKGAIVDAIRTRKLKTREEVAAQTKASTGCGGCAESVVALLAQHSPKPKTVAEPVLSPAAMESIPVKRLLSDYPASYPKTLEIERIKKEGLGLDFEEIFQKGVTALSEDDFYRLKTYGICSQKHPGFFMVRIRIPGGRLTPGQAAAVSEISKKYAQGWVHLTTRQSIELHWVRLESMRDIWSRLHEVGLSTRSSCGHTMRNIMACPHGEISAEALFDAIPLADAVSQYFVQRSESINTALPGRLNIFFSSCPECDPDVLINDIGFRAIRSQAGDGGDPGFQLWIGGSLGAHPILGYKVLDFLSLQDVLPACQAIFDIYSRHGNRNKAKSRLKWLIDQWGQEKFTQTFEYVFRQKKSCPENQGFLKDFGQKAVSSRKGPADFFHFSWLRQRIPPGAYPQKQVGKVHVPVSVPLGEIRSSQLMALSELVSRIGEGVFQITKEQDLDIQNIPSRHAEKVLQAVEQNELVALSKREEADVVACPGTESCVLAVTDAQGAAHAIIRHLERVPAPVLPLLNDLQIAISGCPNSCAKHQIADIGLSGAMTTVGDDRRYAYTMYLGGQREGDLRLGESVVKGLTEEMVVPVIGALLPYIASQREGSESFQEIVRRIGPRQIGLKLSEQLKSCSPEIREKILMECHFGPDPDAVVLAGTSV